MRTSLLVPSLSIQLMAALAAKALRAPTPTAISRDCVAKFCTTALKKRCSNVASRTAGRSSQQAMAVTRKKDLNFSGQALPISSDQGW